MERGIKKLLKAVYMIGPAPCDDCRKADLCATGRACHVFRDWTSTGIVRMELGRVPTAAIYNKLFSE